MAILVAGGAGYIGSHVCVELLQGNQDIVLVDNFSNANPSVIDQIRTLGARDFPVYELDIVNEEGLKKVFAEHPIEGVVHFAGLKAVGESVQKPLDYYLNNVVGSLSLCRVMTMAGCKRLVFSSSATVYGEHNPVPFKEEYPTSAASPYAMTKLVSEQLFRDIAVSDEEWSIVLLRYFNPIGAHPSGLIGEDPKGIPNNLVPYIAKVAAGQLASLNVFGDDYDTKDGTGVRDYLHIVDLAIGHLRALEYTEAHSGIQTFNLGTGTGYTVMEVLRAFEKACGKKIPYEVTSRRPGDIAMMYADVEKASSLLRWHAERGLDEMCEDAWNYMLKHL